MENNMIVIPLTHETIEGKIIYLIKSDISVEIIKPYENITAGLHIPYFAMPSIINHYADSNKNITKRGLETATWLLENLYLDCRYFEEYQNKLKRVHDASGKDKLWEFIKNDFGIIPLTIFEDLIKKYIKN